MASVVGAATGVIGSIFGDGAGKLGDGIAKVINAIRGKNPEDAAKLEELALKHQDTVLTVALEQEKAELQAEIELNRTAGENIRAEITSPDAYVRRARATPVWVVSIGLAIYGLLPLVVLVADFITGKDFKVPDVPLPFWYLSAFIVGGYVGSRVMDRVSGGKGGAVSFLGMKLDSKGD